MREFLQNMYRVISKLAQIQILIRNISGKVSLSFLSTRRTGLFLLWQMSGCRIKHNWEVYLVTGQILI